MSWLVCDLLPPYKTENQNYTVCSFQSFALLWFLEMTALIRSASEQSSSSTAVSNEVFSPPPTSKLSPGSFLPAYVEVLPSLVGLNCASLTSDLFAKVCKSGNTISWHQLTR